MPVMLFPECNLCGFSCWNHHCDTGWGRVREVVVVERLHVV